MKHVIGIGMLLCLSLSPVACSTDGDNGSAADGRPDAGTSISAPSGAGDGPGDQAPPAALTPAETGAVDGGVPLGNLVARVNGEGIPLAEFQRQVFAAQHYYVEQGLDPNTEDGQRQLLFLRRQVLNDMINQVLIEQAAAEWGITATVDELSARMKEYVDEFGGDEAFEASLAAEGTTRAEIEAMERSAIIGEKMLERITADVVSERVEAAHVRHILCDEAADCDAALERLAAGERFDVVARELSKDEASAERGGDLDWIARGMVPSQAFEDAVFALGPGQRSGTVATEYGYHVIEILERDDERVLSAAQVSSLREKQLMEWLAQRRAESAIDVFVDDLADVVEP
jgi:foldase protein PrsA